MNLRIPIYLALFSGVLFTAMSSCSTSPDRGSTRVILTSTSSLKAELDVPTRFSGPIRSGVLEVSSYRFWITLSDMKGMFEEKNRHIPSCTGYCDGLARIRLAFPVDGPSRRVETLEAYLADTETYRLRRFGDFSPNYVEYEVFYREFPQALLGDLPQPENDVPDIDHIGMPPIPVNPRAVPHRLRVSETARRYAEDPWPIAYIAVFRDRSGIVDIVDCDKALETSEPNPSFKLYNCDFEFLAGRKKNIRVYVNFKYKDLEDWPNLRVELIDLVDSFIVDDSDE